MSTPYIGFGNETLANCPPAKAGDLIHCPYCGGEHALEDSKPPMLLFFNCGSQTYMAGIHGKLTFGRKADVSGSVDLRDRFDYTDVPQVDLWTCPACGGDPKAMAFPATDGHPHTYVIACGNPECRLQIFVRTENLAEAIEIWNARSEHVPALRTISIETRAAKWDQINGSR